MRQISSTLLGATFDQSSDEVLLFLLEIQAPTVTLFVVDNTEPVVSEGNVYQPFFFRITIPNEQERGRNQTVLEIDNTDGSILQALVQLDRPVPVVMRLALASDPDYIEAGPFSLSIIDVSWDENTIKSTLLFEDLLTEVYPGYRVTPLTHPAAF